MAGPNRAPLILAVTVVTALAAGFAVQARFPEDHSGKPMVVTTMLVILVGIAVMFAWQRAWYARSRAAANPDTRASRTMWDIVGGSMSDARIVFVLIVLFQPAAIILERPAIGALGAIPIVLFAVSRVVRLMRPGGTLDQAYAATDEMLEPLGLRVVARPRVEVSPRLAGGGLQKELVGPTVYAGQRDGRAVTVTFESGETRVHVAAALSPAKVARLREADTDGARLEATADGVTLVRRGKGRHERWQHDLTRAERLVAGR